MARQLATLPFAGFLLFALWHSAFAGDWSQWRGPQRDGLARDCPPLMSSLPSNGLKPLWISQVKIPAAQNGGWSSPVVADGKVYIFVHGKQKVADGQLPPPQYPRLPLEKRHGMTDSEYQEYEAKRRTEEEQRSKNLRFDELLFCFDAANGDLLWKNERRSMYTRFPQSGTPAVVDGRLYILGAGRVARCIDATAGRDIWETTLPGEFHDEFLQSSFAVADGTAVILAGWLFGLDASTGEILWEGDPRQTSGTHTSPAVWQSDVGPLMLVNVGGETMCIEPKTGRERWRVESGGGHSTPVVTGQRLLTYGNSRKKGLRCFRMTPDHAELEWVFQKTADPGSSPVVVDGYVYVQGERRLACVDLETGNAEWMTTLDLANPRYTSLVAGDQKVFYAFDKVLCFAAQPERFKPLIDAKIDEQGLMAPEETFREQLKLDELELTAEGQREAERLWRQKFNNSGPLPCSSPALVDGRLYLRLKNHIACYELAK